MLVESWDLLEMPSAPPHDEFSFKITYLETQHNNKNNKKEIETPL